MSVEANGTAPADTIMENPEAQNTGDTPTGVWAGRSGLVVAGILAAIGVYLAIGIVTMEVPEGANAPGPQFFPTLITVAIFILAVLLAVQTLRHPEHVAAPSTEYRFHTDWKALGLVFAAFLAFALLLVPVGWILTAAMLFWCVSRALGSRRPLFDIALSLVFSSCIELAFGAGLGLALPGGILEGIYG